MKGEASHVDITAVDWTTDAG